MIAGPSEILVVRWLDCARLDCDGSVLQAEHDADAQPILISPDAAFLDQVQELILWLLPGMERAEIITASLNRRAAMIQVRDLSEAAQVVNFLYCAGAFGTVGGTGRKSCCR